MLFPSMQDNKTTPSSNSLTESSSKSPKKRFYIKFCYKTKCRHSNCFGSL